MIAPHAIDSLCEHAYNIWEILFQPGCLMENVIIVRRLREFARYLEKRGENLYRINAYRRGADAIEGLPRPAYKVFEEQGRKGLAAIPRIGLHLAYTIGELIRTGEFHPYKDPREFIAADRLASCRPSVEESPPIGHLFIPHSSP